MQFGHLKRRGFITLIGCAAAWPLAAHAQQPLMPLVGFLNPGLPEASSFLVTAFREGLKKAGYVEGQSITVEYCWAQGHYDQLQALAANLVQLRVAVIAATGGSISAQAAKTAT